MSLNSIIFGEDCSLINSYNAKAKDYATVNILDQSEGYLKPYIKAVNEESISNLYKHYKFPIIKWCGYPRYNCYNFACLADSLYVKALLNENQWGLIKNIKCMKFYEKIEWAGKEYIDIEPKKQTTPGLWGIKNHPEVEKHFDVKWLIFTKRALYKLHTFEYSSILEALRENNTIIYTLKKYIDDLWKYPEKFYVMEKRHSILSSQIEGMLLMDKMRRLLTPPQRKDKR